MGGGGGRGGVVGTGLSAHVKQGCVEGKKLRKRNCVGGTNWSVFIVSH